MSAVCVFSFGDRLTYFLLVCSFFPVLQTLIMKSCACDVALYLTNCGVENPLVVIGMQRHYY